MKTSQLLGRGVGMDAVQAAAQKMGGYARVETRVGQGSKIIVEVPEQHINLVSGEIEKAHDLTDVRNKL